MRSRDPSTFAGRPERAGGMATVVRSRRTPIALASGAVVVLGVLGALRVATALMPTQGSATDHAIRAGVLCIGLVGLSTVSYLAWPSRWNIPGHVQAAFSLVAYVLPILGLGRARLIEGTVLSFYAALVLVGVAATTVGVLVGALAARSRGALGRRESFAVLRSLMGSWRSDPGSHAAVERRVRIALLVSLIGMLYCFARMGFVPALADDPFSAKFFRGVYAAMYAPVAPIYRAATTAIALLLPLLTMYVVRKRRVEDAVLLVACVAVMLLSLQRDPAVSGVVLCIGVLVAWRGGSMPGYFVLLIGVYAVGSALYYILALVGVSAFGVVATTGHTFAERVAAGAPDVQDQAQFLRHWLSSPQFTAGRTFFGGLVPGNFEWNPSVWSLSVVNPGQNVSAVVSGGLRLPAPLWGYVSFGWPGAVGVSLLSGFFTGLLAAIAKQLLPLRTPEATVTALAVYMCLLDLLPVFYRLSYLSVLQLGVMLLVLQPARVGTIAQAIRAHPLPPGERAGLSPGGGP